MKSSTILIFVILASFENMWSAFADEFDLYAEIMKFGFAVNDSVSIMGNFIMSMGRVLSFGWLDSGSYLLNFEFSLGYNDSEYFFYQEQRARDRKVDLMKKNLRHKMTYYEREFTKAEEGRRFEYFCENKDPNKLKDYCRWAVTNKKLLKKINVTFDERGTPQCEFKFVHLISFDYKTWRTFLRCPVLSQSDIEPDRKSSMFISSVENAPSYRLIFYLFMWTPKKKTPETAESQMIAYEPPRKSASVVHDRDERDRKSVHQPEPSRISLGDIRDAEDVEFVRASLKGKNKMEEIEPIEERLHKKEKTNFRRKYQMEGIESSKGSLRRKETEYSDEENEIEDTEPSRRSFREEETIEESNYVEKDKHDTKSTRPSLSRRLSIADHGPIRGNVISEKPVDSKIPRAKKSSKSGDPKMSRATKSSVDELQVPRSTTRKKVDYQIRRTSLPVPAYTYDKRGRLVRRISGVQPKEPEPRPLEIVTLLINKRHKLQLKKKSKKIEV